MGQAIIPYRDVFHLHGPSIDGVAGLNVWAYASRTFGHAAALEIFGSTFFGNNATFGGFLSPDKFLTKGQVEEILEGLNSQHVGPQRAHRWMVLRGGLKAESAGTIPKDAQVTESRQHQVEEICRWFGVPPHKVAHLLRSTFNNIEHQGLEFVRDALTPWAERMRQEADVKLMPFGNRLLRTRFDLDWLAEGDAKNKAEADAQLVQNGLMSRDEVRRRRALNTRGGAADMLTVQIQNVDIASLENPPAAPVLPAPRQQSDDEEESEENATTEASQK
jgi:HK97 family phage portal protein